MTVQEMHIGIDFLLQKVNSNITKTFKPQEKDWALNEEVIRFINQKTSSLSNSKKLGLEATEKRYDDIRNLITPASLISYVRDSDSAFSYLPADYFSLINDRSLTKNLCGLPYNTNVTISNKNFFIYSIPILDDNTNLYSTFQLKRNGTVIFDLANYGGSLPSSSSKFYIVNNLIQFLNTQSGISAKYENYFDVSSSGCIIIVSTTNDTFQTIYVGSSPTYTSTLKTLNRINPPPSGGLGEVPNRLSRTEDIYVLLSTSFCNTSWDSPLSSLEGGKIVCYHKQNFILSNINISYIRKPKKIDLSLNVGCELSESVHQEIVDNTAKRLAGITNSEAYNQIINENLLKE